MMNSQLSEIWEYWLPVTLQGQNKTDFMNGWWGRYFQNMSPFNSTSASIPWTVPTKNGSKMLSGMQQAWELAFKMQQCSLQFMGMEAISQKKYEALLDRNKELENKVQDQNQTIDRLRDLLTKTGGENNIVVNQLQDLIGQQSKQFKQLTRSVGDYLKNSAEKVSVKE